MVGLRHLLTSAAACACLWVAPGGRSADLQEVLAGAPQDLSVTLYRSPDREAGSIDIENPDGFALIRETRLLQIPAGESRIRFEGVADGIQASSAIITGLPTGVLEKNLDAELLSPESLIVAARGKPVVLVRANVKTGKIERVSGTILSSNNGVVFQTQEGIEALACSGLSDTFSYSSVSGLSASPTLSIRVSTPQSITASVTLSYLALGFDWAADYTATLSPDGKTLDLGAWVTLANANSVGFPEAHTQVVAGKVNHDTGEVEPIDDGQSLIAQCWPQGSTGERPSYLERPNVFRKSVAAELNAPAPDGEFQEVIVTAEKRVRQEQLGDLKLYRVPDRTTVASNESKQVRLLDRNAIPVQSVFRVNLVDDGISPAGDNEPVDHVIRTKNTAANHLGLPLPSGRVSVFTGARDTQLLLQETDIRDLAVNEELEIKVGSSPDVQVSAFTESKTANSAKTRTLRLIPGVMSLRNAAFEDVRNVTISNARAESVPFELVLWLEDGGQVVRSDHPITRKNGRPLFRLTIPAQSSVIVRYQTERQETSAVID